MQYSEFKNHSGCLALFFKKISDGVLSHIFPSPSLCVSQIMWVIKLYLFIYPGIGFVIGFRFEDFSLLRCVTVYNLVEVYGNFRGICNPELSG